jgi:hypothetical protein
MEKNHYGDTILGVVATENIVEGRLVLLTSHSYSRNYGSQEDLPGIKLADNTTEAARARYCVSFEEDNRSLPLYQPQPELDWAERYGWEQAANAPFSATVYLTRPGVQEGATIPSGSGALAFGEGIYTVPSGSYIYSAELLIPGQPLTSADTTTDGASEAGKVKYSTSGVVAEVVRFNTANGRLTFKILH